MALAAAVGAPACGGSDDGAPVGTPEDGGAADGHPTDGSSGDAGADAIAPEPLASTTGPIGLDALGATAFEHLADLRTGELALRETSFDRTGGNLDSAATGNFLYLDDHGDRVLLDQRGPGSLSRMWFTGFGPAQEIHVYFDDETSPRISTKLADLFSGTKAPFLAPLVGDAKAASGGFYSYLPLPFAKAIRVTATAGSPDFYYHLDSHLYEPSTSVTTWSGTEDSSAARALWSAAGADPKPTAGNVSVTGTVSVPVGGTRTLLDVDGPRSIASLHLGVAGVFPVRAVPYTDDGRGFGAGGASSFTVKVDPANEGAVLQRRLDHGIADQAAQIFVDGQLAGTFRDRGVDSAHSWRDDSFPIPPSLTAGKSQVMVRVVFQSGSQDWNEFFYWVYSRVRGAEKLTDTVDVGNAASEAAHAYAIVAQTFSGSRGYTYPPPETFAGPLDDLWIRMTWDGAATPAVDAPLGSFFAQGQYGPGFVRGLAAGMNADGVLYMYFPMPFARHAKVELVNHGSGPVEDVWFDVRHQPFLRSFENVGSFFTSFHEAAPSTDAKDLLVLEARGAGQVVGIVQSAEGPPIRGYLEGDDRVLIDDRRTPAIHGTGTEDIYNGGFYFSEGPYSIPVSGNPTHVIASSDRTSAFRFFLSDAIPFRSHVRFTLEHGPLDDIAVNAWTLAYYYAKLEPRIVTSDTLAIGDAPSETKHAYAVTGGTFSGARTSSFEGEDDKVSMTASGRGHKGASELTLAIDPGNRGVLLRRVLDQGIGRQIAKVFVDGAPAGVWSTPQQNGQHRWREDEILLPARLTEKKSAIRVRFEFASADEDWNEFEYRAYSIVR
jgi:hypothetical protein